MNKLTKNIIGIAAGVAVFFLLGWLLPWEGIIPAAVHGAIGGIVWAVISGDFKKKDDETTENTEEKGDNLNG